MLSLKNENEQSVNSRSKSWDRKGFARSDGE